MKPFYKEYLVRKNTKLNAIKFYLLDKTLGVFFESKPIQIENPKKILIIRNCKIGDMILTTNVFREIRKNFPKAKITVIASAQNKEIIEKTKNIDEIITLDYSWKKSPIKTFSDYLKVFRKISSEEFDVGIEAGTMFPNMAFMYFADIKSRIGYFSFNGGKPFLTHSIEYKKEIHSSISELELIKDPLNIKIKDPSLEIITDEKDQGDLENFLANNNLKKFICICPEASFEKKQWDIENFNSIIKGLQKKYPKYRIILLGQNKERLNYLKEENPEIALAERLNLRVIYLLMKKSSLILAHDGALMHLAWIANSNLIALIPKHMNLRHIGPLGKNSRVIYKEMKDISVKEVEQEIASLLDK